MKLFGQIVRTLVNVATLPVAVAKDVFTLGGAVLDEDRCYTSKHLDKLKREASEEPRR